MKKGFTLIEVLLGTGLAGVLLVMMCGVFVYGLNAIEKGRIRTTALNLADRKISESHNLMKALQGVTGEIKGNRLADILSDNRTVKVNGSSVDSSGTYSLLDPLNPAPVEAEGSVTIKGTGDFHYIYSLTDYEDNIKKVSVEIYWQEGRVGSKKIFLESLVSKYQ